MLRKSFKVRICKTLPKKACLEYHIGNCDAPCEFESAGKKYAGHMAELQNVLSDGKGMVRYERTLEKMMREASNDSRFEEAIEIRETLRRLQSLKGRQNMERSSSVRDEDYVGILTVGDDAHVMSMRHHSFQYGHAFFGSVLHMRTLNDFLSIPMVRSFDVPCVNGPYVFPVPKNFPDLVRLATSSRGYCSSVIRRYVYLC